MLVLEIGWTSDDIAVRHARNRDACRGIVAVFCNIIQRAFLSVVVGTQELERELIVRVDSLGSGKLTFERGACTCALCFEGTGELFFLCFVIYRNLFTLGPSGAEYIAFKRESTCCGLFTLGGLDGHGEHFRLRRVHRLPDDVVFAAGASGKGGSGHEQNRQT